MCVRVSRARAWLQEGLRECVTRPKSISMDINIIFPTVAEMHSFNNDDVYKHYHFAFDTVQLTVIYSPHFKKYSVLVQGYAFAGSKYPPVFDKFYCYAHFDTLVNAKQCFMTLCAQYMSDICKNKLLV